MYAFLIVVTIILPSLTPTKEVGPPVRYSFDMFSHERFAEPTCKAHAQDIAARTMDYVKRHMPHAIARAEISCSLRETRPV
jgi:hypothetical protein